MDEKKPIYKRWLVWVIGVVVIFAIIGNSGDKKPEKVGTTEQVGAQPAKQATPAPTPQEYKVGDKVKLGDYVLTVNEVKVCTPSNQYSLPKAGNKFVSVDLTQENTGTDPRDYNLWYFKLQDDKDFSYQTGFSSCREPSFGSGVLQAGQKTRGYITFEVPKENNPTQVMFTPSWWSTGQIVIKVQ